jgi:hypothetical protein
VESSRCPLAAARPSEPDWLAIERLARRVVATRVPSQEVEDLGRDVVAQLYERWVRGCSTTSIDALTVHVSIAHAARLLRRRYRQTPTDGLELDRQPAPDPRGYQHCVDVAGETGLTAAYLRIERHRGARQREAMRMVLAGMSLTAPAHESGGTCRGS